MNKPELSCSVFFATSDPPTDATKIKTATIEDASKHKAVYLFYSVHNTGPGKATGAPVATTVGGAVKVNQAGGSAGSLDKAYCPNNSCKYSGTVNVDPKGGMVTLKAGSFTILPPSNVTLKGATSANVTLHATGRLVKDGKDCVPAANFTVQYHK